MKRTLLIAASFILLISGFATFIAPATVGNERLADREAVETAILDYVEAIYQVEPERIAKSVSPDLAKVGYWYNDGSTDYDESRMSYQDLYDLAGSWNKSGRVPHDSRKDIEIFDVLDQTATAKLTARWGIDFMHLAKIDGTWMIMNIVWQRHPPGSN
jgi:Putative lumazine-binding